MSEKGKNSDVIDFTEIAKIILVLELMVELMA